MFELDINSKFSVQQVSSRGVRVVQAPDRHSSRMRRAGSSSAASPSPPRGSAGNSRGGYYVGQTPPGGVPQEEIVRQFVPHSSVTTVVQVKQGNLTNKIAKKVFYIPSLE